MSFSWEIIWILINIISVNDWLKVIVMNQVWQMSMLMVNILSDLFLIKWGTAYRGFLISYKPQLSIIVQPQIYNNR